jgi:tetratricopeptide (TPR) repeat protein
VLLQRGQPARAAAILEDALKQWPDNYYAKYCHQLLGAAYRNMGRLDDAKIELAQGGSGRPTYVDPWSSDLQQYRVSTGSRIRSAAALIDSGENDEAVQLLEEMRAEGSPPVTVLNYLGVAYLNLGRLPEAKAALEDVIAQSPDDAIAHANMSLAFSRMGNGAEALRYAKRAVELNPNLPFTHVQLARVLQGLGRTEEASRAYSEAMRLSPTAPGILLASAAVGEEMRRWADVDSLATRVLERDPRNAEALLRRGRARTNLGRFHDARDDLVAAAALRPNDAEIRAAQDALARRAAGPPERTP